MSQNQLTLRCLVFASAVFALAGCIDWEKETQKDDAGIGGSDASGENGGNGPGEGNNEGGGSGDDEGANNTAANGNGSSGNGSSGSTDGNGSTDGSASSGGSTGSGSTGETTGTTGTQSCSAELCNGADDDCDSKLDEGCMDVDDCAALPCENGGTCTDGKGTFTCTCAPGFKGVKCEINIDDCAPTNPCQHGGTCTDGANTVTCSCKPGYQGDRCEIENNDCDPNPCRNGGSCVDAAGSYTCKCLPGYEGKQCETDIDNCAAKPCVNGRCINKPNDFMCECVAGYNGKKCDVNINECAPNPCKNGATCTDGINKATCNCLADYSGALCETKIDDCKPNPCLNGATCADGINKPICTCAPDYMGPLCQTVIDNCQPNPCLNGGTCTDKVADFTCACPSGFSGKRCETTVSRTVTVTLTGDGAAGKAPLVTATAGSAALFSCVPGASCTGTVPNGTTITLTAKPAGWTTFGGFSGAGSCGTNPSCSLSVTGDVQIVANFTPKGAIVFVSSTNVVARGGLGDAQNSVCKQLADAAGLTTGGPFVPFYSTTGFIDDPWSNRFSGQAESLSRFVLLNGIEVTAQGINSLFSGGTAATHPAINVTDKGEELMITRDPVWTGTGADGGTLGLCETATSTTATTGDPLATDTGWVSHSAQVCGNEARVYCFQDNGVSR